MGTRSCLMLFTRYPQAGNTKTRLIPHVGAERAAALQRCMTEYIADEVAALCPDIDRQIHFSGGELSQMTAWLGRRFTYRLQFTGGLGNRLHQAFVGNFQTGKQAVVAIGSDCPELSVRHMEQAFRLLQTHDMVLGPAADGGYYLIGLRQPQITLFEDIPWGTDEVLKRTVAIATRLNLSIATLEQLRDVDRPEDLELLSQLAVCS